jgi:NAD+ kinase
MLMKWGIICNLNAKKACSTALDVYNYLNEYHEVFLECQFAKKNHLKGFSLNEINKKAEVIVTVGGDGTILRALGIIDKPIFAINSGGMGFLSEVESKYAISGLQQVIEGDYNIEERSKLRISVDGDRLPDATNEVTIQTARIAKIIYLQIFIESELLETFGADGVIVSTPTGSTSYALSAGGPILDPAVNAMVIAPLAPFKLAARPWVVPLGKKIGIKLLYKSKESYVVIDGESSKQVTPESEIIITGSEKKAKFIRFGESFYQMVRLKLVR